MIFRMVRRVSHLLTGQFEHRKRAERMGWFFRDDVTGKRVYLWNDPVTRTVYLGTGRWSMWVTTALEPEMADHMAKRSASALTA